MARGSEEAREKALSLAQKILDDDKEEVCVCVCVCVCVYVVCVCVHACVVCVCVCVHTLTRSLPHSHLSSTSMLSDGTTAG